jgi:hypothetical protein
MTSEGKYGPGVYAYKKFEQNVKIVRSEVFTAVTMKNWTFPGVQSSPGDYAESESESLCD